MCSSASLRDVINENKPLILDGGVATQLEAQGFQLGGDALWSARLLHSNPEAIADAHYRFLVSGSDVITTATYQASVEGFVRHLGVTPERATELLVSAVRLARDALHRFQSERKTGGGVGLVAGSVGPYGAFLHDGSEYTGKYAGEMSIEDLKAWRCAAPQDLKAWHRPQLQSLTAAGVDVVAFETIPSVREAQALVQLLPEFPSAQAWISFSCRDEQRVSDGSLFRDAVRAVCNCPQLVAVGVNCCSPDLVTPLLDSARALGPPGLGWVVYPNSGEQWDAHSGRWLSSEKTAASLCQWCEGWTQQGAAFIGGCCRVGPAQITELRRVLKGQ